jgi:hypothetical protein
MVNATVPRRAESEMVITRREGLMKIARLFLIACVTVAALTTGVVRAASTTNLSDQWWVASESGWGASVLQQADILFIDVLVYGADSKPTWFTAAARSQSSAPGGHVLFTGDLYQTNGPYYGGAFNPSAVSRTKVGTLTFDADTGNTAVLTYTVNGVPVVKNVTRQTWKNENLSGSYYGAVNINRPAPPLPPDVPPLFPDFDAPITIEIIQNADNTVNITLWNLDMLAGGYYLSGTYSQSGHMGKIVAEVLSPDRGSITFFDIEKNISGFSGRFVGNVNDFQITDGRIGGVLR